ncbi:MAG: universal stress protein [Saprospirales bacterium]|nr:MAG: universal stress protein [Saprospirales bacterium]
MKRILVPTDFSNCAKAAEDFALDIAQKAGAEIHFLHMLLTPVDWGKLSVENEKMYPETKAKIAQSKIQLRNLRKKAEDRGLTAQEFLVYELEREGIYRHTEENQCDFLVMGSHGTKGLKKLLGSNTQRVVRNSTSPVLVVRDRPQNFEVKNIVFAANFEERVLPAFLKVCDFAGIMQAKIHLLYVNVPYNFRETDKVENEMNAFIKKCSGNDFSANIFNALNEERGILKFAKGVGADMIAVTAQGKKGFMKIMSPSITESLINNSNLPVLSVNPTQ